MNRFIYEPHIRHIYLVLRWQSKHEALHFLGNYVAGFLGCWAYAIFTKWKAQRAAARADAAGLNAL